MSGVSNYIGPHAKITLLPFFKTLIKNSFFETSYRKLSDFILCKTSNNIDNIIIV